MTINEISASFKEDDIEIEQSILEKLKKQAIACTNVREIKRLIKGTFSLYAIRKLCSSEQE